MSTIGRRLARGMRWSKQAHAWAVVAVASAIGCGGPSLRVQPFPHARRDERPSSAWLSSTEIDRAALAPAIDFRQTIRISLRDGATGLGFEGRGALAVRPGRALRMVLLGAGGMTAMDVWIDGDRFRAAIPALDRVVRGDRTAAKETTRGLPIALLRDWMIAPFGVGATERRWAMRARPLDQSIVADEHALLTWTVGADGANDARIRARWWEGDRGEARMWWLRQGTVAAYLEGEERHLTLGGADAVVTTKVEYVSIDPPMRVEVNVEETTPLVLTGEAADRAFIEPVD